MRIIPLGILHQIALKENLEEQIEHDHFDYSYVSDFKNHKETLSESKRLVGLVDSAVPLFVGLQDRVYTLEWKSMKIVCIADNISQLHQICKWIAWIWEPFQERDSLSVNLVDKNTLEEFLADFQKDNPNSDIDFWRHYAFKGVYGHFL